MFDRQFDQRWQGFLEEKAIELRLTVTETRVFSTRFQRENWPKTIEDTWEPSGVTSPPAFVRHMTNIFQKIKPYCPDISKGAGNFQVVRDWLLKEFHQSDQTINPGELFAPEKAKCYQEISQAGALIRIKAPRKMGKTRLLNDILSHSIEADYRTVHINFLQVEHTKLDSLDEFLRWFSIYLSDALKIQLNLDDYWNPDRGSMLSCTRYLEQILAQLKQPLVLGLDEVDRLLNCPDLSQDFFYLLRSWHEEANNDELWEQLRLVVVYSTEDFGNLNINQSPFNVGLPIELKSIGRSQVSKLAQSYNLALSDGELKQLMAVLGGHPFLVDRFMSYLANNTSEPLAAILAKASTDTGIFSSYLRQHLINLEVNPQLAQLFSQILANSPPGPEDTLLTYQLYRMGLVSWSGNNSIIPSCELFRQYFESRLPQPQSVNHD